MDQPSSQPVTFVALARQGEYAEGLAELAFRRHHAQIYHYLRRKTGDADRAEELTQEVFFDATVALSGTGFSPGSMPAWLHTIAKRRFVDDARRRRLLPAGVLPEGSLDELPSPASDTDDRRGLIDAINRLEAGQGEIVAMRLIQGRSFRDIASVLVLSEGAAKMRFQRAMTALRADLERQGVMRA